MLTTPFIGGVGIVVERCEPDDGHCRCGRCLVEPRFDKGMRASTASVSIQYTGAAKRCELLCHARTARRRKELTFTEITATDADGNVVAHAVQTYRIV